MREPIRTGVMIALTSATLLAAACTKAANDAPAADKTDTKAAVKPADPAPGMAPAAPAAQPAAPAAQPEKVAKVHCGGVNACKGKSGCQTAKNACAGQNGCKGEGYVELTSDECQAKGGKVLAEK